MTAFNWCLAWMLLAAFISCHVRVKPLFREGAVRGEDGSDTGLFYILACIPLVIISGLRGNFGSDSYTYEYAYHLLRDVGLKKFIEPGREVGYAVIEKVIGDLTGYYIPVFYLITYAIIIICYSIFFHNHSKRVWLSFALLIIIGSYYTSFNTFRQFFACTFYLFSLNFLIRNKPIPYIISVLLIGTIHSSAFFMLPMYWVLKSDILSTGKKRILVLGVTIALVAFLSLLGGGVNQVVVGLFRFGGVLVRRYAEHEDLDFGINFSTYVKPVFFWGLFILNSKYFNYRDKQDRIYLNTLTIYTIFLLLSASVHMFYRFIYFFLPIILIWIPDVLFRSKGGLKQLNVILLTIFLIVYFFNSGYGAEFYFFWENGIR